MGSVRWRPIAIVVGFALLVWLGIEVGRAGSDVPPANQQGPAKLERGTVSGKRIDGRAWSLDYEHITWSQDGSTITLDKVRDGKIHRPGKPDVDMTAERVVVNTVTNDVFVSGPVTFREQTAHGSRTYATTDGHYAGATRVLTLDKPVTVTEGASRITFASVSADFRTGELKFGRIEGSAAGIGG